jgi:general stress protein 26
VSGTAIVSRERRKIAELYEPDWKMWFADDGSAAAGTPDDPRMVLIGVTVHVAEFLEVNKPRPILIFELVKGWLTGQEPELGEMHQLEQPDRRA